MTLCSVAGVRTVWGQAGGERFFERSTSWTRLSTPPSATSETLQVNRISVSSSFYPEERWVVSTEKLRWGERGWSARGLPADELFSERNTAWKLLSTPPFSVSGLPLVAQTLALSSSCSWGDQEVNKYHTGGKKSTLVSTTNTLFFFMG